MNIYGYDYYLIAKERNADMAYVGKLDILNITQSLEPGEYEPRTRFEGELRTVRSVCLKNVDISDEDVIKLLEE